MRALVFLLALPLAGHATAAPEPAPVPLSADVYWLAGAFVPGQQPDGNSVLFRGAQGWVVVDSGRHSAHAGALLETVAASGLPIVAVVNTHWHLDHVSGNPRLRAAHPELVVYGSTAIDGALDGFLARYRTQLSGLLAQPEAGTPAERSAWTAEVARIDQGRALRPDAPVAEGTGLELGGRSLQLGVALHAATAADVWVLDPASGVLAAGDLVTLPAPFLDTACPAGWLQALDALQAVPFRTLVPGHGAPMDADALRQYRDGFRTLLACAADGSDAAACADGWIDSMGPLLPPNEHAQARALIGYYVPARLRGDAAAADCPAGGGGAAPASAR